MTGQNDFSESERSAIYLVIAESRDVRRGFTDRGMPDDLLDRPLAAAHNAPSVGLMQPTRFIVIRRRTTRQAIYEIFQQANSKARDLYQDEVLKQYDSLKLEGIL